MEAVRMYELILILVVMGCIGGVFKRDAFLRNLTLGTGVFILLFKGDFPLYLLISTVIFALLALAVFFRRGKKHVHKRQPAKAKPVFLSVCKDCVIQL